MESDPFPPLEDSIAQGPGRKGRKPGPGSGKTVAPPKKGVGTRERSKSRGRSKSQDPKAQEGPALRNQRNLPKNQPSASSNRPLDESQHVTNPSQ